MNVAEYAAHDALGLTALVCSRAVQAQEIASAARAAMDQVNARLNAVVYRDDEAAPGASGPFAGAPFLVKALYCPVAGFPAEEGARALAGRRWSSDSALAKRWRSAGLALIGATNTPEFGITGTTEGRHHGPCRNPWNTDHIAGGSSGGAAAAVAAGVVPMAHASDGLGSIRIPAACCGLVGLKPTRNRNPIGPDEVWRTSDMSVDHVVSRTVRDSAALLDWTGTPEADDYFPAPPKARAYLDEVETDPGRMTIHWSDEAPSRTPIHPDVARVLADTIATLEGLGHTVIAKPLALDWRAFYRAQGIIGTAHAAMWFARYAAERGAAFGGDEVEALSAAGAGAGARVTGAQVMEAIQQIRSFSRQILQQFQAFDVFLSPVMITPPPKIGYIDPVHLDPREVMKRQAATFGFTPPFNSTGQPSMSLPLGESKDGLPIGMMFTGRYGDEASLFRLAGQLEKSMPWRGRKPSLWVG